MESDQVQFTEEEQAEIDRFIAELRGDEDDDWTLLHSAAYFGKSLLPNILLPKEQMFTL